VAKQDRKRPAAPPSKGGRPARSGNPAVRSQRPTDQPKSAAEAGTGQRGRAGNAAPATEPVRARLDLPGLLPPDGAEYPHVLRTAQYAWWRSALGVVFGLSLFLLMTTLISQAVVALVWATTAADYSYKAYFTEAYAFRRPIGMLALNLAISTLIPISWLLITMVHQVAPRWLSSVQPRLRWRYLWICMGVAVIALNAALLLSLLVTEPLHFHMQQGFWGFFAVILLTSPIQAAAEEVFFRGYLMQALGSLFSRPWFGVIVSSVVFALFHGTQNVPLFIDRLAFGLLAAILVWKTGGLEAGIAAHVVNNVFAYTIAGLSGSIAELRAIQQITWSTAAFDVGGFALFAVLAYLIARRLKLRIRVDLSTLRAAS
jgi:uncharacterized protein